MALDDLKPIVEMGSLVVQYLDLPPGISDTDGEDVDLTSFVYNDIVLVYGSFISHCLLPCSSY